MSDTYRLEIKQEDIDQANALHSMPGFHPSRECPAAVALVRQTGQGWMVLGSGRVLRTVLSDEGLGYYGGAALREFIRWFDANGACEPAVFELTQEEPPGS